MRPLGEVEGVLTIPYPGECSSTIGTRALKALSSKAKWLGDCYFPAFPTPNDTTSTC